MSYEEMCETLSDLLTTQKRKLLLMDYRPADDGVIYGRPYNEMLAKVKRIINCYKDAVGFVSAKSNDYTASHIRRLTVGVYTVLQIRH